MRRRFAGRTCRTRRTATGRTMKTSSSFRGADLKALQGPNLGDFFRILKPIARHAEALRRSPFSRRRRVAENGPKPARYGPRGGCGHDFHHLAAAAALGAVTRKDSCILPIIGAWSHTSTLG